jgi:sporulation protein YlmC with PRC-barrel domain
MFRKFGGTIAQDPCLPDMNETATRRGGRSNKEDDMQRKLLTTLALALPLLVTTSPAALAASDEPSTKTEEPKGAMHSKDSPKDTKDATDTSMSEADAKKTQMKTASDIDYVTRQKPSEWSAQALIGRDVVNREGEDLGEINNVIINESGEVVAITIGVGGFLGLGEKDVGVPFDALNFETAKELMAAEKYDTADKNKKEDKSSDEQDEEWSARFESEHSNIKVVLDATREQLENAAEFLWLDEQDGKRAKADDMKATR